MFYECLEITWKTADFCILNFPFLNRFVWEVISSIWHSVSSGSETLHLMLDILQQECAQRTAHAGNPML